ncbi:Gamma carbonic anhydrase 3, mitochondrial [Tetrabaena socialis]|uniref:Gamma carbonic anhydrase 3, mitochondrial n=1 Tax=Tetrabaena socialis TaxID=47790 RepID=A0A2J8A8X9_9CHLO|nr:Gamma carbonic anhydrase 3, mitochondrial [Tetrabaena socialis]|eukprot:PNH08923.1 Gamma carbonic anhydrase 3, mitochondrial [Tetrabaena socialis]
MNPINGAKALLHRLGFAMRESGQALERVGCRLQGIYSFEEKLSRHASVLPMRYNVPSLAKSSWVAPSGMVAGSVTLGENSSVWYGAIVRGDFQPVTVGANSNIQDAAYVGATSEFSPPVVIGDNVSIGHGAVLKGCTIGDNVLVGINAVISENVEVQAGAVVAAGAYVEEGAVVPSGEMWAGNPAKKLRNVKAGEAEYLKMLPGRYTELAGEHKGVMKVLKLKQAEYYV